MTYETVDLKSKRLVMKRGIKEDYLKVYEYDFNNLKSIGDILILNKQNLDKIKDLFKGGIKKYYNKLKKAHMFDWIMYLNNKPVGNIITLDESEKEKKIEVSFNVHPNYWGKGYISEALTSVIEYLYSIGYDNVTCTYKDGNHNAKRVLDKLGFKPYEIIKDSVLLNDGNKLDSYKVIMTKEDWFSRTGKLEKIKIS